MIIIVQIQQGTVIKMDFTLIKNNLEKNGFQVTYFETKEEAADYLDHCIDNATVGFGGSVTLQEMGVYERLAAHNQVFWHWAVPAGTSIERIYSEAQTAEIYLSSVNGIAETGEIVNIDGIGNRISSIQYGHKKVFFIVGANKIVPDYESAVYRARNIAAPKNAQRLKKKTPCAAKADKCHNCNSPERICRGLSVLWKKPLNTKYEIVLIQETLGY